MTVSGNKRTDATDYFTFSANVGLAMTLTTVHTFFTEQFTLLQNDTIGHRQVQNDLLVDIGRKRRA